MQEDAMALRLIPGTDDGDFPYEQAKGLLHSLDEFEIGEVDFPAMIEKGKQIGWTQEMIDANWGLMKRGKCFSFIQHATPFLQGTMYEDNILFSFSSREHEDGCRRVINDFAKRLGVRVWEQ
jgi:hypothetical protein